MGKLIQYKRIIHKQCKWIDKEAGIWDEDYISDITMFGFIRIHYEFINRHDMSKLPSNKISGFGKGKETDK